MSIIPSDVAFTPTVKAMQTAKGSRTMYARMENGEGWESTITPELAEFIARQDMLFRARQAPTRSRTFSTVVARPAF